MREWKFGECCEHGSLGRQCLVCEVTEERDEARAEVVRWKAEAMAAREMIGIALDVDGYPYPFKRSASFGYEMKYLDIRRANEKMEVKS